MTESATKAAELLSGSGSGAFVQDGAAREVRGVPGLVPVCRARLGAPAGRRHALPPGVLLQGGEGPERAVGLQGGQVPKQEPGLRECVVQETAGRGEQDR